MFVSFNINRTAVTGENELLILLEHLSTLMVLNKVCVAQYLVAFVMFCWRASTPLYYWYNKWYKRWLYWINKVVISEQKEHVCVNLNIASLTITSKHIACYSCRFNRKETLHYKLRERHIFIYTYTVCTSPVTYILINMVWHNFCYWNSNCFVQALYCWRFYSYFSFIVYITNVRCLNNYTMVCVEFLIGSSVNNKMEDNNFSAHDTFIQ